MIFSVAGMPGLPRDTWREEQHIRDSPPLGFFSSSSPLRSADGFVPSKLRRLLAVLKRAAEARFFSLGDNPWAEPPEAVVNSGMPAVISYFEDMYSSSCKVRRNSVKVVLVGQEGAGKTR